MRFLRISLVTLLLGPLSACLVTTESGHRTAGPGPSEPSGASLAGQVVDARTHAPIHQAAIDIVTIERHNNVTSVSTAPDGTYHSATVPPGRYIINVRRKGYDVHSYKEFELRPGTTELNVEMQPE